MVDDRDHEDRPRRTEAPRAGDGFNETAGYGAVALTALATGYIAQRWGLRPEPFFLGLAYAGLGLGLSVLFVRETRDYAHHEATTCAAVAGGLHDGLTDREIFTLTSFREKALSAACQAGMVNNLNDGLAWGLFPIFFAASGLSVGRIGVLAAIYPAVWGLGQLYTGGLSDRIGRKPLIVGGMLTQAAAIAWMGATSGFWTMGGWRHPPRRRDRDGLPDPAGLDRRRRPSRVASTIGRHLSALARLRVRRRRAARRRDRRPRLDRGGDLRGGSPHRASSGIVVIVRMYETHPPSDVTNDPVTRG